MTCYMGVDIGTSGCKAVVFNDQGRQVSAAYREYDVISAQPGWAELDSDEVMTKCFEVIADSTRQSGDKVVGIGVSSQGEAFTPVDASGKALGGAMVSFDMRAEQFAESFTAQFGADDLYEITGHTAHPMFSLFKLLWLKENQPDVWSKAAKFLCFEDLLQLRLGLDPAIGWPLAARTMLFDVRRHEWSRKILDATGLSPQQLARPLASGERAGQVNSTIAADLGLADGAFVVAGGHDQPCGALGAGITNPKSAVYATGTVECITPAFSEAILSDQLRQSNLCTYDYTVKGMYTTVAFSLTGGSILKWFRDQFGQVEVAQAKETGRDAYEILLSQMPDKPTGLTVLPYFTPSGTPYFDTRTPGAILGLRLTTTRADMMKALLEGVALEMRLNTDILERCGCEIQEFRAIGGGARSAAWTQLKADVLGKPIAVCSVDEAGCCGVAMLARAEDTGQSLAEIAGQWSQTISMQEPRREFADFYAGQFESYKKVYLAVRDLNLPPAQLEM